MHRSRNNKIGMIIVLFSLLITIVFVSIIIVFQSSLKENDVSAPKFYSLSNEEVVEIFANGDNTIKFNPYQIIDIDSYNKNIMNEKMKALIPLSILFLVTMIITSFLLWFTIKSILMKQSEEFAQSIKNIETDVQVLSDNIIFNKTYDEIKTKYNDYLKDYKRLNSYLSHEQKNSLSILKISLEQNKDLENIKQVDNIISNIDDVLTLSDTATDAFEEVDVTLICASVCDKYRKVQQNIYFDFPDSETVIYAKNRWIYRAISNLVDNAVKYGNGKDIFIFIKKTCNSVIVQIEDNGIGIEKDKQEMIFKDRYRIRELKKDGYGIGLSLVSYVCDLCGGIITLESEVDKGTKFYLAFPLCNIDVTKAVIE